MKKKLMLIPLTLVLLLLLTACGCEHAWLDATCTAPKTCQKCGQTEGEMLPHTWQDPTCIAPKTCSACSATEGEPLGHTWRDATCTEVKTCTVCQETEGEPLGHVWTEASCTNPKTCSVCSVTEGENAPHTWQEATCTAPKTCFVCNVTEGDKAPHTWQEATTEAPKTCQYCDATEGDRLITDSRFTTKDTRNLQGTWVCDVFFTDEMMGLTNFGGVQCRMTLHFGNTGNLKQSIRVVDEADYLAKMKAYTVEEMYATFANRGMSREQADQAMLETYGLNVTDYVAAALNGYDVNQQFSALNANMVYYVQNGILYTAMSWNARFEPDEFAVSGNTLRIDGLSVVEGGETLNWTRG